MDHEQHEALCERCGISCYGAATLPDGKQVVIEGLHCKFLDVTDGKAHCIVYEDRFEKAPWCLSVGKAAVMRALRDGCPYTNSQYAFGKRRLSQEEYDKTWPQIVGYLTSRDRLPRWATWSKFFALAEKRERGYRWFLYPVGDDHIRVERVFSPVRWLMWKLGL